MVVLIVAFIREVLATGQLGGEILGIPFTIPALALPFGGFLLVGFLSALARRLVSLYSSNENKTERKE